MEHGALDADNSSKLNNLSLNVMKMKMKLCIYIFICIYQKIKFLPTYGDGLFSLLILSILLPHFTSQIHKTFLLV